MSSPNVVKTIEIWADTKSNARCRDSSCGAKITWAEIVKSGRKMPFNGHDLVALRTRHDEQTRRLIEIVELDSHFSTCSNPKVFRK